MPVKVERRPHGPGARKQDSLWHSLTSQTTWPLLKDRHRQEHCRPWSSGLLHLSVVCRPRPLSSSDQLRDDLALPVSHHHCPSPYLASLPRCYTTTLHHKATVPLPHFTTTTTLNLRTGSPQPSAPAAPHQIAFLRSLLHPAQSAMHHLCSQSFAGT